MRAWQVQRAGEPADVLRQVEVAAPQPGPGQVQIRVTAAGLGLPDVLMCRGTYPLTPPPPFTPGQEATGVVSAVGEGVALEVGARIMCVTGFVQGHGAFAERCLALAESSFPVPDGLGDVEAAGFWIPHLTGWIGLVERGGVRPGEWLAVLGASGGSGIAAVQLGRALGARVVAVVSDDEKGSFCEQLGAERVVNHRAVDVAEGLRAATDGRGPDVIYDPVGGTLAERAARTLARGGRHLLVGFASGGWATFAAHDLAVRNVSAVGVFAGGHTRAELEDIHARLASLVADGSLRNAVDEPVPFDDLPQALQRVADRDVLGKLVMLAG